MPCPDQTSLLKLKIAADETVIDYTYSKYTCGKPIGVESGLKPLLAGKPARAILSMSPRAAVAAVGVESEEDRLLVVVEHEALTAAVGFLFGIETPVTPRYSVNRMSFEDNYSEIDVDAAPLATAPKIPLPCTSYPGADGK